MMADIPKKAVRNFSGVISLKNSSPISFPSPELVLSEGEGSREMPGVGFH